MQYQRSYNFKLSQAFVRYAKRARITPSEKLQSTDRDACQIIRWIYGNFISGPRLHVAWLLALLRWSGELSHSVRGCFLRICAQWPRARAFFSLPRRPLELAGWVAAPPCPAMLGWLPLLEFSSSINEHSRGCWRHNPETVICEGDIEATYVSSIERRNSGAA